MGRRRCGSGFKRTIVTVAIRDCALFNHILSERGKVITVFMESAKERELSFDIRRTVILGAYMREWEMPEYRVILSKPETGVHVEIYYFPAAGRVRLRGSRQSGYPRLTGPMDK